MADGGSNIIQAFLNVLVSRIDKLNAVTDCRDTKCCFTTCSTENYKLWHSRVAQLKIGANILKEDIYMKQNFLIVEI